jgi:hypothetical protein
VPQYPHGDPRVNGERRKQRGAGAAQTIGSHPYEPAQGGYDPGMQRARTTAAWKAIGRALRWKPRSHWQAWLSALGMTLPFIIVASILNAESRNHWPSWPGIAIGSAALLFGQGLAHSHHLFRRRNGARRLSKST